MGKILNHRIINRVKESMAQAEEKKKELRGYIRQLYEKYSKKEISYSFYIETLYKKFDGKDVLEWIEHFEDYIKNCKKKIRQETRKLVMKNVSVIFVSAIVLFAILTFGFDIQKILGFTIESENINSAENIPEQNITAINNESYPGKKAEPQKIPSNTSSQNSS